MIDLTSLKTKMFFWQARIQFIINLRYIKVCKRCTNICILLINWDPLNLSLTFFLKVIVINLKLTILSDIVQSQAPNSVQLCLFIAEYEKYFDINLWFYIYNLYTRTWIWNTRCPVLLCHISIFYVKYHKHVYSLCLCLSLILIYRFQ